MIEAVMFGWHRGAMLAAVLPLAVSGCGGAPSQNGATLREQYRAALQDPSPASRAEALVRVGYQQYRAGDRTGAEASYAQANKATEEITDPYRRGVACSLLATAYARSGDSSSARKTLDRVNSAIAKVEPPENKADLAARIAVVYAKELRQPVEAAAVLKEAERLTAEIPDPQDKAAALGTILGAYQAAGKTADVDRLANVAGEVISTISDARRKIDALATLGQIMIAAGRKDEGLAQLDTARKLATAIKSPYSQAFAIAGVAERYLQADQIESARSTLVQAQEAAASIPEADLRKEADSRLRQIAESLPDPQADSHKKHEEPQR